MEHSFANILKNRLSGGQLLWPAKMLFKYLKIKAARGLNRPAFSPIYATLSVTRRCNSKCLICRAGDDTLPVPPGKELTFEEFKPVIDGLRRIGTEVIGITGGEPLLREDVFELCAYIKSRKMGVHFSTNGNLLDERRSGLLLDAKADWVNISMDGASAASHDALRGIVSFDGLLKNIERFLRLRDARGSRTKLNLVMVINKVNLGEARELVALARRLGVDGLGFMPFHPLSLTGAAAERLRITDLAAAERTMAGLLALKKTEPVMENTGDYLKLFMGSFRGEPFPLKCYALFSTLAVDASGNVYPCFPRLQTDRKFGNVAESTLEEVLCSEQARKAMQEVKNCKGCYWNCHTELNLVFNRLAQALLGK
ncbi:MAG TPA: hypothetical protein DCZ92_07415 [Elusimicrobia bacterium]|nr:MAG: hypothetical protein A2016_03770 [Elusimicrobia bacterium GWF2_62_30]HBA60635.1 hypothetical protein [Elusimicrobiota bacterium]